MPCGCDVDGPNWDGWVLAIILLLAAVVGYWLTS